LLGRLLTAAASLVCRVDSGFFFGRVSPVKGAAHCAVPLVFFHGERDMLVPSDMCRELFDAAGPEKEMALVPDAPHIGSWFCDPENYFSVIMGKAEKLL
ncbi:MAG: alpha/beta hydrolase, partial [Spirochaetaceae bacterium]|nr:alpha/beta hydrolase [Spirochaetaceae bacterium]